MVFFQLVTGEIIRNLLSFLLCCYFEKQERHWGVSFLFFRMKFVLHFFGNISSLECRRPILFDSSIEAVRVEKIKENFLDQVNKVNGCSKILMSGLLKVATFPHALLRHELLQLCIYHYDARTKSILNRNGELVLSIMRETISSILCLLE